jgi:hypothetical protein
MKAKLIKRWEEDAMRWTPQQKAAIKFARVTLSDPDDPTTVVTGLWSVYAKGTQFEGEKAAMLVAAGLAVEITE